MFRGLDLVRVWWIVVGFRFSGGFYDLGCVLIARVLMLRVCDADFLVTLVCGVV